MPSTYDSGFLYSVDDSADRAVGSARSLQTVAQVRTLDEASALANAIGEVAHDGYIQLKDGRHLRARDEVIEWVYAMADATAGGSMTS